MSLNSALYTGVSGLSAYSNALSVIGNNIANVNTTGYKENRTNFADILGQSSGGVLQIGRGVLVSSVNSVFTQGTFQATSLPGDLAIDGDGLFLVKDPQTQGIFYTRSGNFTLNSAGKLTNPQGLIVQGFSVDSSGNALPTAEDISITGQSFPPSKSANATIQANLDAASALILDPLTGTLAPFNPANPVQTSQFSTALTLYDSLGTGHTTDVYFQKTGPGAWNWFAGTAADQLAGQTGTALSVVGSGSLTFASDGALDTVVTTADATGPLAAPVQGGAISFDFAGGAQAGQAIALDFGTPRQLLSGGTFAPNPNAPTGFEGTTQFAAASSVLLQSQDGYGSGILQNFSVDAQGKVKGLFSNGQSLDLNRVALAKFPSTAGLKAIGNNLFSASSLSGEPIVAGAGSSGTGTIQSGALEGSNVDLSSQFVDLIRTQQAFQANAKVITTTDQLLNVTVNLKQ